MSKGDSILTLRPALHGTGTGRRLREPVTTGIPFPRGVLIAPPDLRLASESGASLPLQCAVLDRWSDGSVRWMLLDYLADVPDGRDFDLVLTRQERVGGREPPSSMAEPAIRVRDTRSGIVIDTGPARFELQAPLLLAGVSASGPPRHELIDPSRTGLWIVTGREERRAHFDTIVVEEVGTVRTAVRLAGHVALGSRARLDVVVRLHFFAGSPVVRAEVTIRNPRPARHPGGKWVLGDTGSVLIEAGGLDVRFAAAALQARCSLERHLPFEWNDLPLTVYQDSSGGEAWASSVHRNRNGEIRNRFKGYRCDTPAGVRSGFRASPIVSVETAAGPVSLAVPQFWENCPRAVEASADGLRFGFFPGQYDDDHELQGGEQKTHECFVAFGTDSMSADPLTWCREPTLMTASPAWYAASGVMPYLTSAADDPHPTYLALVQEAVDGPQSFSAKRERIDEYGWRNFGDLYADHEAVRHTGPNALVSHYNNQYDAIAGFAIHFLRTGDRRWWQLMHDLAAHVRDIDVYHTTGDKAAYNGGLFWHTRHYTDAGTSTHRTYPSDTDDGGGPSAEHNYTTGLLLHHYLTGSRASREGVMGLADWVLAMDDGDRTVFRLLARGPTGLATATGSTLYHGPGRAAANSIVASLNAWELSGEGRFIAKAEEIVRRCIHPGDDIAALNLLDAERRWYYTVFLQALGVYLDVKNQRAERDEPYHYAREGLLHYARWMAEHEYPYLDRPDILEFPNETWDAQDLRKSEVFDYAALHAASSAERQRFLERAEYFFVQATSRLRAWPTHALTRPLVLLLVNGFRHAWFARHWRQLPEVCPVSGRDFGRPAAFVPQRHRVIRRVGQVALLGGVLLAALAWSLGSWWN